MIRKRVINNLVFGLILLLLLSISTVAEAADKDSQDNVVRVGYFLSPGYQEGAKDEPKSGYGYEYLQKIASYTGWEYEYVYGGYSELIEMLRNGEIDLMGNLNYTNEMALDISYPSKPQGVESFSIYTTEDNQEIDGSLYFSLNDKTVGVISGSFQENLFKNWCAHYHVKCSVVGYDTNQEWIDAINRGELDAVVSSTETLFTGLNQNWIPVIKLGSYNFYFGVSKKRPDILGKLNDALNEILSVNEFYGEQLHNKYFYGKNRNSIVLSKSQKQWLLENDEIQVGYLTDYMPLCDKDKQTGQPIGMIQLLVDAFREQYGIECQLTAYDSYSDMVEDLRESKLDALFPMIGDYWFGETEKIILSDAVTTSSMMMSYSGNYTEQMTGRVAVAKSSPFHMAYVKSHYPNAVLIECDTYEQAVHKAFKGEADCVLTLSTCYQMTVHDSAELEKMNTTPLSDEVGICLGINMNQRELLHIINCCVQSLDNESINNVLVSNSQLYTKYNFKDFAEDNLVLVLAVGASVVFVMICIFIIYIIQTNNYRKVLINAKEEAERAEQEAINANIAKTEFLSRITHDIRTPLNGIVGMLDIADRNIHNQEKVLECHDMIHVSSKHLLALINDVIDMSKIETGENALEEEAFNLRELLDDCISITAPLAVEKGIVMDVEGIKDCCPLYVYGSPLHVRQVFINLVGNAIKFTQETGTICCNIAEKKTEGDVVTYEIAISDTGIGMSEEFQKHLFEPFAQEHRDNSGEYQGSGLGLSIVKKLVDQMGGTISCTSEQGKGTCFLVTIPFRISSTAREKEVLIGEDISIAGLNILVVEDNAINMEIAKYTLVEEGANVVMAFDGEEAVDIFRKSEDNYFDMILMDILMPKMDGLEATRQIRKMDRADAKVVPIVAISANAYAEDIVKAKEAGMDEHMSKPLDMDKLMEIVAIYQKKVKYNKEFEEAASRRKQVRELEYQASHDPFTGVLTKNAFFEMASQVLEESNALNALMVIDMDNFKRVNDNLGHATGDEVILKLAKLLNELFRGDDFVGRFGGDEFMIFLNDVKNVEIARKCADRVVVRIREAFAGVYEGIELTTSVGVTCAKDDVTMRQMFEHADKALYLAKKNGKNQACVIDIK